MKKTLSLPNHSLPCANLIKHCMQLYIPIFKTCLGPIIVMSLLYSLPNTLAAYLFDDNYLNMLLALICAYLSLIPYVLTFYRVKGILSSEDKPTEESPLQKIYMYYIKSLLPFSILVLLAITTSVIASLTALNHQYYSFIGFFIIFLIILFSLGVVLVVLEDMPPIAAVKRSVRLVWGQWWHTFAIFFVLFLLPQMGIALLQLIFGFGNKWLITIIHLVGMIAILPLAIAALTGLSHELKYRYQETKEKTTLTEN